MYSILTGSPSDTELSDPPSSSLKHTEKEVYVYSAQTFIHSFHIVTNGVGYKKVQSEAAIKENHAGCRAL